MLEFLLGLHLRSQVQIESGSGSGSNSTRTFHTSQWVSRCETFAIDNLSSFSVNKYVVINYEYDFNNTHTQTRCAAFSSALDEDGNNNNNNYEISTNKWDVEDVSAAVFMWLIPFRSSSVIFECAVLSRPVLFSRLPVKWVNTTNHTNNDRRNTSRWDERVSEGKQSRIS